MTYQDFINTKRHLRNSYGFEPIYIPESLFDFQKHIGAVITSEEVQKSLPDEITRIIQKSKMEFVECEFKPDFDELEVVEKIEFI